MDRVLIRSEWQGPCVVFTGKLNDAGYGHVKADGKDWKVHRLMWTLLVGPIPDGMTLDHLCRNRACWWSDHLEPVTQGENVLRGFNPPALHARKTHCPQGHEYNVENTRVRPSGKRSCIPCDRASATAFRARRRALS